MYYIHLYHQAHARGVEQMRDRMFSGEKINITEVYAWTYYAQIFTCRFAHCGMLVALPGMQDVIVKTPWMWLPWNTLTDQGSHQPEPLGLWTPKIDIVPIQSYPEWVRTLQTPKNDDSMQAPALRICNCVQSKHTHIIPGISRAGRRSSRSWNARIRGWHIHMHVLRQCTCTCESRCLDSTVAGSQGHWFFILAPDIPCLLHCACFNCVWVDNIYLHNREGLESKLNISAGCEPPQLFF